jgi:hypothetical protein
MCDLTHGNTDGFPIDLGTMEWVLQVVDEIDDAIGAMRHGWVGFTAPIGMLVSSFGAALRIRGSRLRPRP